MRPPPPVSACDRRAELCGLYLRYCDQPMSPAGAGEQRRGAQLNALNRAAFELVSNVPHPAKFANAPVFCPLLLRLSSNAAKGNGSQCTGDWAAHCFDRLRSVAAALRAQPWRADELGPIAVGGPVLRAQLGPHLPEYWRVLQLMGYEAERCVAVPLPPDDGFELVEPDRLVMPRRRVDDQLWAEQLLQVAVDCVTAAAECKLMQQVWSAVGGGASWPQIAECRRRTVGDAERTAHVLAMAGEREDTVGGTVRFSLPAASAYDDDYDYEQPHPRLAAAAENADCGSGGWRPISFGADFSAASVPAGGRSEAMADVHAHRDDAASDGDRGRGDQRQQCRVSRLPHARTRATVGNEGGRECEPDISLINLCLGDEHESAPRRPARASDAHRDGRRRQHVSEADFTTAVAGTTGVLGDLHAYLPRAHYAAPQPTPACAWSGGGVGATANPCARSSTNSIATAAGGHQCPVPSASADYYGHSASAGAGGSLHLSERMDGAQRALRHLTMGTARNLERVRHALQPAATVYCPNCGNQVSERAAKCDFCMLVLMPPPPAAERYGDATFYD